MVRTFKPTSAEKIILRVAASASVSAIDAELIENLNNLTTHCLFMIFDHLSLQHLYRLSLQPDRLNIIVKEYVLRNFKGKEINISKGRNGQMVVNDPYFSQLLGSAQTIKLHGRSKELIPIVARESRLKPKTIVFKDLNCGENHSTGVENSSMKSIMEHVESAEFIVNKFDGKFFDNVLKHAINMRRLKIVSNSPNVDYHAFYKSKWCFFEYPNLESLQWDNGIQNERHFRHLLNLNPGIKTITFSRKIHDALEFIDSNKLKLNKLRLDLSTTDPSDITSICSNLTRLFNQGAYQSLHLTFGPKHISHIADIASLVRLESVEFCGHLDPSIEHLPNLKELTVESFGQPTTILKLKELRKINIKVATFDSIRSVIGSLKYLKEIVVTSLNCQSLPNIDVLIGDRAQLAEVSPTVIYIEEWAYLKLKKYSADDRFDLIKIRRIESLNPN